MADKINASETLKQALNEGWEPPEKGRSSSRNDGTARWISIFEEISVFCDKHGRAPSHESEDINEKILARTLAAARKKPDWVDVVREFDRHNLLNHDGDTQSGTLADDTALDDGATGTADGKHTRAQGRARLDQLKEMGWKPSESISDLKHVRPVAERTQPDRIAKRKPCKDFEKFRHIFENVQKGLEDKIYAERDLEGKSDIKVGGLFVLGGQIAYVADAENDFSKGSRRDARLRVIFQNGKESDMLKTSFLNALAKDLNGRVLFEDITGTIYVLRSLSEDPYIKDRRDMIHKIGFTTGKIKSRLSTAHLHPTYLMAGVKVVRSYKISNVPPRAFERLFHKFFYHVRLEIVVTDRFNNEVHPKEWFDVPLEAIDDFVATFQEVGEGIQNYRYDRPTASLAKKDSH